MSKVSPWFGKKYRVTPESSKVLQELVFKDGGRWVNSSTTFYETDVPVRVKSCGTMYVLDYCAYDFTQSLAWDMCKEQDGTKQLEEYMEKMKEQDEWVGCHIGEANKIVSMSGQSLHIKFIRNGKEEVLPDSYKDTVFVYLIDFDCYANIPTEKIYQAYKPKIETIFVDGVEYDKNKFDAAMKAMKEAEVK